MPVTLLEPMQSSSAKVWKRIITDFNVKTVQHTFKWLIFKRICSTMIVIVNRNGPTRDNKCSKIKGFQIYIDYSKCILSTFRNPLPSSLSLALPLSPFSRLLTRLCTVSCKIQVYVLENQYSVTIWWAITDTSTFMEITNKIRQYVFKKKIYFVEWIQRLSISLWISVGLLVLCHKRLHRDHDNMQW